MSSPVGVFFAEVNEDGSFSVLGRVCSLTGTGDTVNDREGPCLKQADVSTIACKVYDLGTNKDADTGTPVTPDPALTPAANLYDTLQTLGWDTYKDPAGYNFRHDVAPTYVPTGGNWYALEYLITLTGGGKVWRKVRVKANKVIQS